MIYLKSLAFLVFLTTFGHAHDGSPSGCRGVWSRPENVIERPVFFRIENSVVADRHARLSGLEGSDCGAGFVIHNLEITSNHPGLGAYAGGFNCLVDYESYEETGLSNFDFLREVLSGPTAPGILEVRLVGENCLLRYHASDRDLRARYRDYSCTGQIASDDRVTCQHLRHLKKKPK